MENQKKLHNLLTLTVSNEKKLEDFLYNIVKIEVKEKIGGNTPLDAGGFCYIFGIKADVTYVNSSDMKMLPQNI